MRELAWKLRGAQSAVALFMLFLVKVSNGPLQGCAKRAGALSVPRRWFAKFGKAKHGSFAGQAEEDALASSSLKTGRTLSLRSERATVCHSTMLGRAFVRTLAGACTSRRSPMICSILRATCAAPKMLCGPSAASENPIASAPRRRKSRAIHPPVNPVWPVRNTRRLPKSYDQSPPSPRQVARRPRRVEDRQRRTRDKSTDRAVFCENSHSQTRLPTESVMANSVKSCYGELHLLT
jgi:hypothetical protein